MLQHVPTFAQLRWLVGPLLLACLLVRPAQAQVTLSYTGGSQTYTVPAGVTSLQVIATGASGGTFTGPGNTSVAGLGARVQAVVPVTPGEVLTVMVGGQGTSSNGSMQFVPVPGGYNGGGSGSITGGGGGATDLRRAIATPTGDYLVSRNALVVAGGSGGSDFYASTVGGSGGTPNGGNGSTVGTGTAGQGATQAGPGSGLAAGIANMGGISPTNGLEGGGGGGGYYGGGAGNGNAASGGGGSSWVAATGTNVSYGLAAAPGNGSITLTPYDLVVSTIMTIQPGTYNSITVTGTGYGALVGNVTVNTSTVVQAGGTFSDGCYVLSGPGSFTLAAGGSLIICNASGITMSPNASGAIQNTGARNFSTDANYTYSGVTFQVTGTGLPPQVRSLGTTNAMSVVLINATAVSQLVTVAAAGNLLLNNNALTLLSSASGTALVVNSGTGVVSGATATMQRYIDASANVGTTGYRHYSTPVSGPIVSSFSTSAYGGGFTAQVNALYNTQNPNTLTMAAYPSVFSYDESKIATSPAVQFSDFDKGYQSPLTMGDVLTVGRGYAVQIGNTEKVQFTGTLNTGTQTIGGLTRAALASAGGTSAGWALVGNPYPAPLDWGTVGVVGNGSSLSGVDPAIYVFRSTNAYSGAYTSFNNGVGAGTGLVAAGQAFFVHTTAPGVTGSITLTNANRGTAYGPTPKFQRQTETRPLLRLSLGLGTAPATVATTQDETFVYFEAGAIAAFDGKYDAYKLANPSGYYLGTAEQAPASSPELGLSINGRAPLTSADDVVPVWLSVPAGTYTLTATELRNMGSMAGGTAVYLRDALTGTLTNLATASSYPFQVAANASAAGRFSLVFRPSAALATTSALREALASVYPNPTAGAATLSVTGLPAAVREVQAALSDALGRPVGKLTLAPVQGTATAALPTAGLAGGVYVLRLEARNAAGELVGALPLLRLSVR